MARSLQMQAGARSVSQPPTPSGSALAGDASQPATGPFGPILGEHFVHAAILLIMHAPVRRDLLLDRADAAIAAASRLSDELSDKISAAYAERRRAEQADSFLSGLNAPLAISLLVEQGHRD